jgi:biotin carboxyl carrier protein
MKMLRITLQGKTYEVGVEVLDTESPAAASAPVHAAPAAVVASAPPARAPAAAAPAAAASAAGGHTVTSPMPGVVMKLNVAIGQEVAKDQVVLVLDAMKMESPIYAPCAGTVSSILVRETDAVVEGQVLIQLS